MADPNTEQSIQDIGIPVLNFTVAPSQVIYSPVDKTLSISEMPADAKATGDAIANLAADISDLYNNMYPVGSVYMTIADTLPAFISSIGTWEEVLIPMTWGDIRTGTRNYAEMESGQTGGTLHMWLRTA